MIETAVYLNAAITAYDVRRELDRLTTADTRVVYGVFDLVEQRVRGRPALDEANTAGPIPIFSDVPQGPEDFSEFGIDLGTAVAARRLQGDGTAPVLT